MQKNVVLVALIIVLIVGVFVLFCNDKRGDEARNTLKKTDVDLSVNNRGPFEMEMGHGVRKDEEVVLGIRSSMARFNLEEHLSADDVKVSVEGANPTNDLQVTYNNNKKLFTGSYVAKNSGIDNMKVVLNGRIEFDAKIVVLDNSFFAVPIDLGTENVLFSVGRGMSVKSSEIVLPSANNTGGGWCQMDIPGYVYYSFESDKKEFHGASLKVFPIAKGAVEKYDSGSPLYDYGYLHNVKELRRVLDEKTGADNRPGIANFPPIINAALGVIYDVDFFDFKNGSGVRYLIPGYNQAHDSCKYPTYTYQGITRDGKYLVLFRYEYLYSPDLDAFFNEPDSLKKDYDEYVKDSCNALMGDKNLSPSLSELDKFARSIEIKE